MTPNVDKLQHVGESKGLNANFRDEDGKLFLVRCYVCEPNRGRENYLPAAATGECAWCGWKEKDESD